MHTYDAAVMRRTGVPALAVTAVAAALGGVVDGGAGAAGGLLGGLVVCAVLATTTWLCSLTRDLPPATAMAVALGSYAGKVLVLGAVLLLAGGSGPLGSDAFPLALVAVTLTWMAGEVRAFSTLRTPYVEPEGWTTPPPSPMIRSAS